MTHSFVSLRLITSSRFLQNTGVVGGVLSVVGIIVLSLIFVVALYFHHRYKQEVFDREVTRQAAATSIEPFFDNNDSNKNLRGEAQFSDMDLTGQIPTSVGDPGSDTTMEGKNKGTARLSARVDAGWHSQQQYRGSLSQGSIEDGGIDGTTLHDRSSGYEPPPSYRFSVTVNGDSCIEGVVNHRETNPGVARSSLDDPSERDVSEECHARGADIYITYDSEEEIMKGSRHCLTVILVLTTGKQVEQCLIHFPLTTNDASIYLAYWTLAVSCLLSRSFRLVAFSCCLVISFGGLLRIIVSRSSKCEIFVAERLRLSVATQEVQLHLFILRNQNPPNYGILIQTVHSATLHFIRLRRWSLYATLIDSASVVLETALASYPIHYWCELQKSALSETEGSNQIGKPDRIYL